MSDVSDGAVSRIGIVIFRYGSRSESGSAEKEIGDVQIMERFMIDVSAFPVVDKGESNEVMEWGSRPSPPASVGSASLELDDEIPREDDKEPWHEKNEAGLSGADTPSRRNRSREGSEPNEPASDLGVDIDLAEQMRAALISLTARCAELEPLPDKCTFNIAMELKDETDLHPPIGQPQAWIPVQPSLQKRGRKAFRHATVEDKGADGSTQESSKTEDKRPREEDQGGLRFTPIKTVEAGTFRFETWVEEWRAKFEDVVTRRLTHRSSASAS
ncbi:hypothetical protein N0V87_010497 [Didymella glomerata]|uniref:Uncharacterized protein n=1 Tax=Didymella glomerata TaxID=749621 RepID=A0A9W8WP60_9PLEO|nr:hypothetical protein N0V87_010497 [Didymella glomerata]